ncbi:hypothetical protein [uncultured Chitinophaga sp.]|uniref:hypothetical protein n=1 Tax=uncultured Chitinophaga sp. TaxID=339340 RepID=UPI0025DD47E5|nr:hypothetical protein [uncultured Chitinophaga sp.]
MKRILIALIITSASTAAFAQDSTRTHKRPMHEQRAKMQDDLKLDEKQSAQVKDINKEFMSSAQAIQKNKELSKEERKSKLEALDKERSGKLKTVMNDEQFTKWESNRAATRAKMEGYKEKRHDKMARGKGKRGDRPKQDLGLNEEQSKQLKSINGDFHDKTVALRNNKDLSEDQRKAQFKQLREQRDSKLKATLSTEQYEKIQQRGKRKPDHKRGAPVEQEAASENN